MQEIELKARVRDREAVRKRVDSFAEFTGKCRRSDVYWADARSGVQVRIRLEERLSGREAQDSAVVVTYKRKQLRAGGPGVPPSEVNEEFEFAIDRREPFEEFLRAAGFRVVRRKEKLAEQWRAGRAVLELCAVPPLGDFLEIEILSESAEPSVVAEAREELSRLLERSGLAADAVETRYYNDMLAGLEAAGP